MINKMNNTTSNANPELYPQLMIITSFSLFADII